MCEGCAKDFVGFPEIDCHVIFDVELKENFNGGSNLRPAGAQVVNEGCVRGTCEKVRYLVQNKMCV